MDTFPRGGSATYKMDLYRTMKYFDPNSPFRYRFGDRFDTPDEPAFIKARSLTENSDNAILLRFNSLRHFRFGKDPIPFQDKKDMALWRGTPYNNPLRTVLLETHANHPKCDVQGTRRRSQDSTYGPKKIAAWSNIKINFSSALRETMLRPIQNGLWHQIHFALCPSQRGRLGLWRGP